FLEPVELTRIELIFGCVVKIDELHATHDPVVVSFEFVIVRIIMKPLIAQRLLLEPVSKLDDVLLTGFRRNRFVIADTEEYWKCAEGGDLILQEVIPGMLFVIADGDWPGEVFRLVLDVLIESGDGTKIAQMPIKGCAAFLHAASDRGHNDIAAISGIAGHSEAERA